MSATLEDHVTSMLSKKQRKLKKRHGTPAEFAQSVYKCVPGEISMDEARSAVAKYQMEWDAAGKIKP